MTATRRLSKLLNNVNNVTLSQNDLNRLSDEQDSLFNNLSKLSGKKIQIPRIKYKKFVEDLDGIDFLKLNNISNTSRKISRKSSPKKTLKPRRKSSRKSSPKKTLKPRKKQRKKNTSISSSLKMTTKTVNKGKGKRKIILCLTKEI